MGIFRFGFLRTATRVMCSDVPKGLHILRDPLQNKGVAFSASERQALKLTGLIPPIGGKGAEFQGSGAADYLENVSMIRLRQFESDFDKYDWLMNLCDRNKELFYRLMSKHADYIMPLVYTPTVGQACQNLGLVYNNGRGLFVTIHDKGNIKSVLQNWPEKDVRAICVTDGERILGLGDQGAFGMGIPVGKLSLYTGLAGIPPQHCLPVTLDVGTNSETLLNSPLYFGLKQKRVTGQEYDEFINEFMEACTLVFGKDVLIQFEDFANHNAFRLLHKYDKTYCTFNDDIQGTASVVLAALLASPKLTGRKLSEESIVCYGSGEAALGFAHLVTLALNKLSGMSLQKAKEHIYLVDSKGLVVTGRKSGGLTEHKLHFARPSGTPELTSLEEHPTQTTGMGDRPTFLGKPSLGDSHTDIPNFVRDFCSMMKPLQWDVRANLFLSRRTFVWFGPAMIIKFAKCTALIGAAAVPRTFTPSVLNLMSELNEKPLIMALSNPTKKAECTAEEAYKYTHGRGVFASGSPFLPVSLDPKTCPELKEPLHRHPGQANNAYIFPGVALAIVSGRISPVTDDDFLVASETLASLVSESDYSLGRLFPPLSDIRHVSATIAREVILAAVSQHRCHAAKGDKLSASEAQQLVATFSNYPPAV